jgi:hypothetical protein
MFREYTPGRPNQKSTFAGTDEKPCIPAAQAA